MLDFFRDPVWFGVFVGFLAVIVPSIVAVVIYLVSRRRRELSYQILASTPVISVQEEIASNVKIFYEDKPIEGTVHLVIVKIFNSGNEPVRPNDYYQNITLSFGENAKVLLADVIEHKPENLKEFLKVNIIQASCIELQSKKKEKLTNGIPLNSGWGFTTKCLVSQLDEIKLDGMIHGFTIQEKQVDKILLAQRRERILLIFLVLLLIPIIIAITFMMLQWIGFGQDLIIITFGLMTVVLIIGWWLTSRKK